MEDFFWVKYVLPVTCAALKRGDFFRRRAFPLSSFLGVNKGGEVGARHPPYRITVGSHRRVSLQLMVVWAQMRGGKLTSGVN